MKYFILSNSAVVCDQDKTYTISNKDYRYEKIKKYLFENNIDQVKKILEPSINIQKEGLCVKDGLVYFNDDPIPTILGNQFLEIENEDDWQFKSVFNFWYNLKERLDDAKASEIIESLISKNAYPVTEDGVYLVYLDSNSDQTKSNLNKNRIKNFFNFYNYSNCPNELQDLFVKKNSLNQIISDTFGFCSKKLYNILVQKLFDSSCNFIKYKYFFYGVLFKDILANENIVYCLENNVLNVEIGNINNYKNLNSFLRDFSIEKNGNFNQKRIMNFMSFEDKNKLLEIGTFYNSVKKHIEVNLQDINFSNNPNEIHEYFYKEYQKIKDPIFDLNNDDCIEKLNDVEFENYRVLVPRTNYDLKNWSSTMNNCISTYAKSVVDKTCQLIAIVDAETNEMLYNIEIANRNVQQFLGKRNKSVDSRVKEKILDFLRGEKIIFSE